MKRIGILTLGFIFLFTGIGFAALNSVKFSTLKTDDKLLKGTNSISSTSTATRVGASTVRPAIEAKASALKSGGALTGPKVSTASQVRTTVRGVPGQRMSMLEAILGAPQKAAPTVTLPRNKASRNNAPITNLKVPAAQKSAGSLAMPKIGSGTKIGGITSSGLKK